MVTYYLALLGPFELTCDPAQSRQFESDKVRALLAFLATEPGPHRRETLANLLWPEKPELRARRNLSQALYNLRRVISPAAGHVIQATSTTVQLKPGDRFQVDINRFERSMQVVAQHRHLQSILCDECRRRLETAVDLYRGQFLDGLHVAGSPVFEDWVRQRRSDLQDKQMEMLRSLAHSSEMLGDYAAALMRLRQANEMDPLDEKICRQRMRLLARSGQRNAALRKYEQLRCLLWDELGVEPEERTQSFYQQLLAVEAPEDVPSLSQQLPGVLGSGDEFWSEAQTLEVAGEMARARGEYANARNLHERALKLYEAADDRRGVARSLSYLGLTARDTGDLARAESLVRRARQTYLELGDRFSSAEMNVMLARLLLFLGEFSNCVDLLKAALPVYAELGLQQRVAYFTGGLALNQMMMGSYDEARANARQSIQVSYVLGDQMGISFGMSLLGVIALAEERDSSAEQLLKQALVLTKRMGRPEELGGVLSSLCYLMLKRGDFRRARLHVVDGLQVVSSSHNVLAALFVLSAAALYLRRRGDVERAESLLLLCKRFAVFQRSPYFVALYGPHFGDWDTNRPLEPGAGVAPDLLWKAVTDLLRRLADGRKTHTAR